MARVAGAAQALGLSALRVLALTYVGVMVVAAAFADHLIFVPPPPSYTDELPGLLRLPTAAGDTVAVVHLEAPDAPLTVVFAHGNAEDIGDVEPFLLRYRDLGVSVAAFDYPGYGLGTGRPSEPGAYAAADAVYDYLVEERGVDPSRLVVHGKSLGGGVAVDLASRRPVAALVVESSFVSAYRVMTRWPLLPVDQFRSLKKMDDVSAPVLVIHGTRDEVIAPWHGRRLAEAVPEARRSTLWVDGAGHNDLVRVAGARYWEALGAYLSSVAGSLRRE